MQEIQKIQNIITKKINETNQELLKCEQDIFALIYSNNRNIVPQSSVLNLNSIKKRADALKKLKFALDNIKTTKAHKKNPLLLHEIESILKEL